jgi:hypothetical protein|nr:MAG TPA_asm: hypothetical protein [Caudoviricetes sp.]
MIKIGRALALLFSYARVRVGVCENMEIAPTKSTK